MWVIAQSLILLGSWALLIVSTNYDFKVASNYYGAYFFSISLLDLSNLSDFYNLEFFILSDIYLAIFLFDSRKIELTESMLLDSSKFNILFCICFLSDLSIRLEVPKFTDFIVTSLSDKAELLLFLILLLFSIRLFFVT